MLKKVILSVALTLPLLLSTIVRADWLQDSISVLNGLGAAAETLNRGGSLEEAAVNGAITGGVTRLSLELLEEYDRNELYRCRNLALYGQINTPFQWRGRGVYSGDVIVLREGYHRSLRSTCREYRSSIYENGMKRQEETTISCVSRNGAWVETTTTEVIFGQVNVEPYYPYYNRR